MTIAPAVSEPDLLEAAITNAERGFHVFPLGPHTKVPVFKQWEDNATCDVDRIRRWWRRRPTDNIAVACGPTGLHVLDLDTSHDHRNSRSPSVDPDGRHVLAQLAARNHQPLPVPTYTVQTPSIINGLVRVLLNVIEDWSKRVFASLIHCYQRVCNNTSRMHRAAGLEDR
ncbi:bifunctional DNA primase/polymerase [Nocardia sp. NPDC057030]|uniref:bifunctional DNA primase/polymerase n=1 Tax=unclassified Nocardia TaxID=2637762 RepID=UPI00363219FD